MELLDHPDGALTDAAPALLAEQVRATAARWRTDGLVVFDTDGVTGHPDHTAATRATTRATTRAAATTGLPVLAWTLPRAVAERLNTELGTASTGRPDHGPGGIDLAIGVHRASQLRAVRSHPSQAVPGSARWRRLELLGDLEHLVWLPADPTGAEDPAQDPEPARHPAGIPADRPRPLPV